MSEEYLSKEEFEEVVYFANEPSENAGLVRDYLCKIVSTIRAKDTRIKELEGINIKLQSDLNIEKGRVWGLKGALNR